jgi:long-chain acyl-CoA synthetase
MSYRNLAELFRRQAERLGPRPALRFRRHGLYHDLNWQDYHADALACAAALVEAGIAPGDRVGIFAENRPEWLIADMGILAAGAVTVPPHAPLPAPQVRFQLRDAGVSWLFVSTAGQLEKIRQVRHELPELRGVVLFDPLTPGPSPQRGERRDDVESWAGFLQRGQQARSRLDAELARREAKMGTDDLATIIYTSGTTGNPKGVMLSHGNLLSNALACNEASPREPDALVLCWLPLSHIYARTVDHYVSLAAGVTVSLAESADTVVRDLRDVQPTHLSCVPRFYEKLLAALASADAEETGRRLRAVFGPRIVWLGSGGAPLPAAVAHAYHDAGLPLLQGYGLTESSPVISFNRRDNYRVETVGQPLPGVEVRLASDGEVLTRGPHVMRGYWNDPKGTAEVLRDGWLHTGDLGRLDEAGFLTITGRKKEILVLSNGKKVVPSHIEGLLLADPCLDQAMVCGEGRNYLTALLVPHWENLRAALREEGAVGEDRPEEELAADPAVQVFLRQRVDKALAGVSNWERVKKFVVLPQPFTVAGGELTVSLKLRRGLVLAKYRAALEALYCTPGERPV